MENSSCITHRTSTCTCEVFFDVVLKHKGYLRVHLWCLKLISREIAHTKGINVGSAYIRAYNCFPFGDISNWVFLL